MVPLARWLVCGSGAVGVPVVVVRRRCLSLGALLSFSRCWAVAGIRWAVVCWVLAVVVPFACGYRGVGRLSSCWVAGLVRGGVGCVTWHAGDMEGASVVVDAGDVAVWLSDWFVRR